MDAVALFARSGYVPMVHYLVLAMWCDDDDDFICFDSKNRISPSEQRTGSESKFNAFVRF